MWQKLQEDSSDNRTHKTFRTTYLTDSVILLRRCSGTGPLAPMSAPCTCDRARLRVEALLLSAGGMTGPELAAP